MSKRLQVVLNKDVRKLGKNGDLVEVARGYARNYLIPQGMAIYATPGILRQVEQRKEKERQRVLAIKQEAEAQKLALQTIGRFIIRKRVGESEAIFGTVTNQDVADTVLENSNLEVDRRGITLPDISTTGFFPVTVKLHPEVTATIEIQVASL